MTLVLRLKSRTIDKTQISQYSPIPGSTRKPVDIEKITTENAKFFKYTKFRKNTKFTKLCGL